MTDVVVAGEDGGPATADPTPLWSCATSLSMCLLSATRRGTPGPGQDQLLRDVHAYQLAVLSDGDVQWLTEMATAARQRARSSARLRGGLPVARLRLGRPGRRRLRFALSASTRNSRTIVAARWTAGATLAEAAAALLDEAGADLHARARVVAEAHRALARFDWSDLGYRDLPAAGAATTEPTASEA